jgi:hypothetical protein
MKKLMNFRTFVSVSLSLALLFAGISCDREPTEERPDLPPVESLVMDFSDFSQQPGGQKSTDATYENFLHAYLSVLFWNAATTVTLALPVTAYGYALQQDAVYLGDHTWEWAFDFPLGDAEYTATLTGARLNNEEFSMEMVIAPASAPEEGIKWFDGVVRYDHTHATWNLYKEGSVKVIEAEWNKDFETEEGDLTYTYVEEGHEQNGSYIMFQYMPGMVYDAAYTISLVERTTYIEWNTETLEGRVKDTVRFEDSEWHCWAGADEGFADKVCE